MVRSYCLVLVMTFAAAPAVAQPASPAPAPPDTKIDASRGGITITSGVNSLTIGARGQFRWTLDDRDSSDADTVGPGVGQEDGALSAFDFPRMRLTLSGGVYRPWLKYRFELEFSRTGGEGGSRLKDAFLEIRPVARTYRFQAGQFKVPFGLQQLTSSGRLQFVDRAITDIKFNPSRDQGVAFGGTAADRKVGYDVGLFNGSGESLRQNNRSHLWATRVYVNPLSPYSPAESAVDAVDKPILHVGLGLRGGKAIRGRTTTGVFENADNQTAINLEFAYKARRFFATAEQFWMTEEQQVPSVGRDIDSLGFHAQAGYMLMPKRTEVAILFAHIDPDSAIDDAAVTELRGAFSYFWQAHNFKLQADIGQLGYGSRFASLSSRARLGLPALGTRLVTGRDLSDTQVRVQLQVTF